MYDFSILSDDTVFALRLALVLFTFGFISFVAISLYTLIKSDRFSNKHNDKLKLVCEVAYFH